MTKEYDQITAFHYSAFRPALHLPILEECLTEKEEYELGLDVGCGTGQSAIALANYCKKVIGIDPSKEMLEQSIPHSRVSYRHFDGHDFDFQEGLFDIITFAGVLHYAKSQRLFAEVVRVSKDSTRIVVYDFELLLDTLLEKLGLDTTLKPPSNYDHEANFDGLGQKEVKVEKKMNKRVSLKISIENIGHLLLSSKDNYSLLVGALGRDNIYSRITRQLNLKFKSESIVMEASTYSTVYLVVK